VSDKTEPLPDRWLDAAGVGLALGREPEYVLDRLAPLPDFPKAWRRGHPRWKYSEVMAWAERDREVSVGRPRRRAA
jgi:hypothetical protein